MKLKVRVAHRLLTKLGMALSFAETSAYSVSVRTDTDGSSVASSPVLSQDSTSSWCMEECAAFSGVSLQL